jgi:hypothetical protein
MEKISFTQAFIKAKDSFDRLVLSKSGNKNKYADIEDIRIATEKALHANGIMLIQKQDQHADGSYILKTELRYKDVVYVEDIAPVIMDNNSVIKNPQQQYGAALSYTRRYSAMTVLGLRGHEKDLDDYNHSKVSSSKSEPTSNTKASYKQIKLIKDLVGKDDTTMSKILSCCKVTLLNDMSCSQADEIIKQLNRRAG